MKKFICLFILMSFAGFAMAHWAPADGHKMHYPQLPDPNGWDVYATNPKVLADDWQCSETGWIWDIHFWGSWKDDLVGTITLFHLSVHADIPADQDPYFTWSHPGTEIWSYDFQPDQFTIREYDPVPEPGQGWYDPNTGEYVSGDHLNYYQYNFFLPIDLRIDQEEGTIYWLDVSATVAEADRYWGWKTSLDHWNDDAVYWWEEGWGPPPGPSPWPAGWYDLHNPIEPFESLDMAFVINGYTTLPVELSKFTAQYLNNVPTLYWVTQSEIDNIGWYVYCNTEDDFTTSNKISNLIEGHGTTSEPHSYIYEDNMLETIPGDEYWYWIESVDLGGEINHFNSVMIEIPDSPGHPSPTKPVIYAIQNSPNPFRSSTKIRFTLSESALAEVTIYNIIGEKVKTLPLVLASEDIEASAYWDGKDESGAKVAHGIYFYTLKAGESTYSGKMIHIR